MTLDRNRIQVGNIGTRIRMKITDNGTPVDISTATVKKYYIRKPGAQSETELVAEFDFDGTDGWLAYDTVSGDLSVDGVYFIQAYVALPPDKQLRSKVEEFTVYANV